MAGIIDGARTNATTTPLQPLDPGDLGPVDQNGNPIDPNAGSGTGSSANPVVDNVTPAANPLARGGNDAVTSTDPAGSQAVTQSTQPGSGTSTSAAAPEAVASAAPSSPTSSASASGTGTTDPLSWAPTSGIVDQIRGITPQTVDGTGYTSGGIASTPDATATGYGATGYTATQGTAATTDENVSQAVDRITSENSPLMQRAASQAADTANDRGLLNTTMGVQAGQAAVMDLATQLAQGDVQVAESNAAEKNAMTIANVQQANAASQFHAAATNDAAQFAAAARNSVSQFNSQEAQQKAITAAQLWDQAAQFSAQAKQAADTFNADSYNKAMQSYVDAKNAAIAAQNDAVNLSRRDTAQINAGIEQANIQAGAQVAAAGVYANASMANAQLQSKTQEEMQQNALTEDMNKYNLGLTQQQQEWASQLSSTQFNQFQQGYTSIMGSQMEPDAKQTAINNYFQMWTASGELPFNINPPGGTGTP